MKQKQIIITSVLILLVGIGSFFAGTKYQQSKIKSQFTQQMAGGNFRQNANKNSTNNNSGSRGQMAGNGQNIGEITKIDDTSITIKTTDGGSKIILISNDTTVSQNATASKSDLKVGTKVAVIGESNTDGSITGKRIEINPAAIGQSQQ